MQFPAPPFSISSSPLGRAGRAGGSGGILYRRHVLPGSKSMQVIGSLGRTRSIGDAISILRQFNPSGKKKECFLLQELRIPNKPKSIKTHMQIAIPQIKPQIYLGPKKIETDPKKIMIFKLIFPPSVILLPKRLRRIQDFYDF